MRQKNSNDLLLRTAEQVNNYLSVHVWPLGKPVGENDGLTELLHIPNSAKVVNIKDPQPGMWSIKVNNAFFTCACVYRFLTIPEMLSGLLRSATAYSWVVSPVMRSRR